MVGKLGSWDDDDTQSRGISTRQLIQLYRWYAKRNASNGEIEI